MSTRGPGRGWSRALIAAIAVVGIAAAACTDGDPAATSSRVSGEASIGPLIQVHRSPTCDCCHAWEAYLREQGFGVESVERDDLTNLKRGLGVPGDMVSCHTAIVDGYFVEGHVPVDAIERLLAERPAVDGIALPGMPPGSPGMGGAATGPLVVYAITDGVATEFARS